MKNGIANPKSAAIISFFICLPFVCLFTLLVLHIEPNFGPLQPLLTNPDPDQPNILGSLIALSTVLLVLAAFIINLNVILRTIQGGGRITTYPVNLLLAAAALTAILLVIGSIIIDQYPCWIGVPNCD